MSRAFSAEMLAALSAAVVRPIYAVECDFSTGVLRANSSAYTLTINGASSLGVAKFGGVTPIEETAEIGAYQMGLKLWGVPRDLISIALTSRYQGRRCTIWFGCLDDAHALVPSPFPIFKGRMDTMKIDMGETATITLTVANRLEDWDRPRIRRYTDADQQEVYPGDGFFRYVPRMQDFDTKWGRV